MKHLALLLLLLPFCAHADLLDRVRLEDALRTRLEQVVQVKDPKARVLAHVEFKTYKEELPGTSGLTEDYSPSKLELSDVAKLDVEVYSELNELPAETRDSMYKILPISRDRVHVVVKHVDAPAAGPQRKFVEAKDLSEIAQESIRSLEQFGKLVIGGLAGLVLLSLVVFVAYSSRKLNQFKDQFALLANAISENGGGRAAALPQQQQQQPAFAGATSSEMFAHLPAIALNEIFADCYWCEADGYAHWLWSKIEPEQRSELLSQLPFMSDYSLSFVAAAPVEARHHDHPYYLNPVSCAHLAMDDVNKALSQDLSVWHRLSPLRQAHVKISLEQKLKAVQSRPAGTFDWKSKTASAFRKLKTAATFGDLSTEDEVLLFDSPSLAPVTMRSNIRSLVWLAHRDEPTITKVLARYDARSLASAWVGAEPVLKKLEACLPEKKLKLLQMYRERQTPTRASSVYEALVQEGLKDEAA